MRTSMSKIVMAGVVGTLVMTAVGLWVAPMMGIPAMNPAQMLAGQMGGMVAAGWAAHLMIGVILTFIYANLVASRLPGPPAARGAIFSLAPWLMAQLVVIPMMGMPLFSGSMQMAMGSLVGHLVFGAVIGMLVGEVA